MERSIIHHVCIVLALLWLLSHFDRCHPVAYFISLIYLYLVHERYVMRLKRKLKFEERRQANQRRVLSDSETVRWLNHAVEKIWPVCMEQIVSQKILLPIVPWFLQKYKPWTAKEAVVQHLYLGRSPPMFTDMRVLRQSTDDDHLVLELGMNFRTADDMSAILAVKLRKRLGFGMWAKLHLMGLHVEGKVLIGVKFIRQWPFLGRLRVCFVEPPYFQMTVKPISTHGLNVTEIPGIAGWLDKLLAVAFEQTLVEPNMLIVDVEKFASPLQEVWFSVDEKEPVAYAIVEVVEAADMKPSDMNGLADPYVKGQLGPYRFRTKTQKKTLAPKWHEEFKIPISSWDSPNVLNIGVRDKDHFVDDTLGDCSVSVSDLRDGQRHDMWLSLQNIKMGRLHLAITVFEGNRKVFEGNEKAFEGNGKVIDQPCDNETLNDESKRNSVPSETAQKVSFSSESSEKSPKVADSFEPINIDGQQETGIWVHHPGSEVSQIWEPRKGKNRVLDAKICNDPMGSFKSLASGSYQNESSSTDESLEGNKGNSKNMVQRGLHKIGSVFHRSSREHKSSSNIDPDPSPRTNLKAINSQQIGVKFIVDDNLSTRVESPEGSQPESPSKKNMKDMAKSIFKHAERSARSVKHALSRKGSRKSQGDSECIVTEKGVPVESESSDDESLSSSISTPRVEVNPDASNPVSNCGDDSFKSKEDVQMTQIDPAMSTDTSKVVNLEGLERIDDDMPNSSERNFDGLVESYTSPKLSEEELEEERKIGLSS